MGTWTGDRSGKPLSSWYGVQIDPASGRAVKLGNWVDISGIAGPISPSLGRLTALEVLDLSDNRLAGPIPPRLGELSGLIILDLGENELTGTIPPELGRLTHLHSLRLGLNRLSGEIPPELGQLRLLQHMWLAATTCPDPYPASSVS